MMGVTNRYFRNFVRCIVPDDRVEVYTEMQTASQVLRFGPTSASSLARAVDLDLANPEPNTVIQVRAMDIQKEGCCFLVVE